MANFHKMTRSNYFKVEDPDAFKAWARKRHMQVRNETIWNMNTKVEEPDPTVFAMESTSQDGWVDPYDDPNGDIFAELATHLADKQVAILMEVGWLKEYVKGWAIAVHANGKCVEVVLDDIYDAAKKEFGDDIQMRRI
jgi:hypothetical protein